MDSVSENMINGPSEQGNAVETLTSLNTSSESIYRVIFSQNVPLPNELMIGKLPSFWPME